MNRSLKTMAVALISLGASLSLASCGSSSSSPTSPGPAANPADVTITIISENGNMSFGPSPATMKAGQTVSWHNADGISHTATANAGAFDTGQVSGGATTAPIKMSAAGSFPYHCSNHPSMVSTLTVTQ